MVLAFLAVRSDLRAAGEARWSALALPFIVMGSTMFAILPGMEFALLAAVETGADVAATQAVVEALDPWFLPVLLTGSTILALGALGFAVAIARRGVTQDVEACGSAGSGTAASHASDVIAQLWSRRRTVPSKHACQCRNERHEGCTVGNFRPGSTGIVASGNRIRPACGSRPDPR